MVLYMVLIVFPVVVVFWSLLLVRWKKHPQVGLVNRFKTHGSYRLHKRMGSNPIYFSWS